MRKYIKAYEKTGGNRRNNCRINIKIENDETNFVSSLSGTLLLSLLRYYYLFFCAIAWWEVLLLDISGFSYFNFLLCFSLFSIFQSSSTACAYSAASWQRSWCTIFRIRIDEKLCLTWKSCAYLHLGSMKNCAELHPFPCPFILL